MQDDALEVMFCDLCGTSVPAADLAAGTAMRHAGKTVGACCLPALRGAAAPGRSVPGDGVRVGEKAPLLPVAVVLLAAVAAATIFLDQKITSADTQWRMGHDQVLQAQRSDSDVLQALGVAMDGVARKGDLDVLAGKLDLVDAALQRTEAAARQQGDTARDEIASMRRELRAVAESKVDPRLELEALKVQVQRAVEAMAASARPAEAAAPAPAPATGEPVPETAEPAAPALPPALAEAVKKLGATDPAVRFEAVDELLRSKNVVILPQLLPLARDPDTFVRRLTVEGLRDFKRVEAVDALLAALADGDEYVRDTAWRSLKEVTGQKIPFETNGTKEARARAVQRWQEWWDKNKSGFGS